MTMTRPRGEQLRFESTKTGSHVLDDYLEAVERGSRSLPDLIDDLFDEAGAFRSTIFEFREDPGNPGIIQFRVGDFVDPNAGWINLSYTDFASMISDAEDARDLASSSASTATSAKNDAVDAKNLAISAKDAAVGARDTSVLAKNDAVDAKNTSEALRDAVADIVSLPTDPLPISPLTGHFRYDDVANFVRVWDGVAWAPVATASMGGLRFEHGTFGPAPSGEITVGGGFQFAMVWLNGVLLADTVDYTTAPPLITILNPQEGDKYFVWAYQAHDSTDYYTKGEADNEIAAALSSAVRHDAVQSLSSPAQAQARSNIGLGDSATRNVGTTAGTVAAGNDSRITGALPKTGGTMTGQLALSASTFDAASLNIVPGFEPTYPMNGDLWFSNLSGGLRLSRFGSTVDLWDSGSLSLISKATAEAGTSPYVSLWSAERVAQAIAALTPPGLGVGQTWQDVKASRSASTTYQNTTGKPIMVAAVTTGTGGGAVYWQVSEDGTTWTDIAPATTNNDVRNVTFAVPNGWRYRINGTVTIDMWAELR